MTTRKADKAKKGSTLPSLGLGPEDIATGIRQHYSYNLGRDLSHVTPHYLYTALALTLRDRIMERWRSTKQATRRPAANGLTTCPWSSSSVAPWATPC